MRIPSLELWGPDDRVPTGMPVDPLPTRSNFPSGLSFPVCFPFSEHIIGQDHILTEVQEEDLQEVYSI